MKTRRCKTKYIHNSTYTNLSTLLCRNTLAHEYHTFFSVIVVSPHTQALDMNGATVEEKEQATAQFLHRRQDVSFLILLLLVATAQLWIFALRELFVDHVSKEHRTLVFFIAAVVFTIILFVVTQYIFKIPLLSIA